MEFPPFALVSHQPTSPVQTSERYQIDRLKKYVHNSLSPYLYPQCSQGPFIAVCIPYYSTIPSIHASLSPSLTDVCQYTSRTIKQIWLHNNSTSPQTKALKSARFKAINLRGNTATIMWSYPYMSITLCISLLSDSNLNSNY